MNLIKCPLNYTGNKFKLLPQLLPYFPANINTFVDLFAGSYTVGININAKDYVCNDIIKYVIEIYEFLKANNIDKILSTIEQIISAYDLSKENLEGYNKLREYYNSNPNPLLLFILSCYAFNNQIRFNNNHQYNSSFGKNKSQFNDSIKDRLILFTERLKQQNVRFFKEDYKNCLYKLYLNEQDLVYVDPPYLASNAVYNDGNRGFKNWSEREERNLLSLLDDLNSKGIRFALSNVLENNGVKNEILSAWAEKYNVYHLNYSYHNSNYHRKNKDVNETDEVLITNYGESK